MGIDLDVRLQLLRLAVVRRAPDLALARERRRFATNMALVYRVPEIHVLALVEAALGLRRAPPRHAPAVSTRPTPRLPTFDELRAARGQGRRS